MKLFILSLVAGIGIALSLFRYDGGRDIADEARQVMRRSEHAMALFARGQFAEAKSVFSGLRRELAELVGPRDPAMLNVRNNFAQVLHAMGDFDGAEIAHRGTLLVRERAFGRWHPDSLTSRQNLAMTQLSAGKLGEALENVNRAESGFRKLFGVRDPKYLEVVRLKELIEESIDEDRRRNEERPSGPSGLREMSVGTA